MSTRIDDVWCILMLHQLVYQLIPFPLQVHECPSQVTSVHNLTYQALLMIVAAMSLMGFEPARPREEPILICWMVTLWKIVHCMYGLVLLTPLWC